MIVVVELRRMVKEVGLGNGYKIRILVDELFYIIGVFKLLIDFDWFNKLIDDFGKDWMLVDGVERNDLFVVVVFFENLLFGVVYEE